MKNFSILIIILIILSASVSASNNINVVINGKIVNFTKGTGYPFVDENNRTMVPLKITMESAGATVGYDTNKSTAIVITEHDRIEIPIGTKILYNNNIEIQNDAESVIKDNRVYLPIRAVLESADFTVEWDSNTNTLNAYKFKYDPNEFVPYSTGNLKTLTDNVLRGNVVYINGNYYATPKYMKTFLNTRVCYSGDDLNIAIYPEENRYDAFNFEEVDIEWVSGITNFEKLSINKNQKDGAIKYIEESKIPNYVYVYGFYEQGLTNIKLIYAVDEMTDEFMNSQDGKGVFNGIRMKKENGTLYFDYQDLKSKNLIN